MVIRVIHLDVFTTKPGKGNPAGIVLSDEGIDQGTMQQVAARTGFSDTAFVSPSSVADFRIRYFSPSREVALCGHATIAAAVALRNSASRVGSPTLRKFTLETNAGTLPIEFATARDGSPMVSMTQARSEMRTFKGSRDRLVSSLGISVSDLSSDLPVVYGYTGRWTLVVPVRGLDVMARMSPRPEQFASAMSDFPETSVHPFSLESVGRGVHMHERHFSAPSSGTVEDPVTGTASGVLGVFYREFVNDRWDESKPLLVEQGLEIGREGLVHVWAVKDLNRYAVRIAGTACVVEERDLRL